MSKARKISDRKNLSLNPYEDRVGIVYVRVSSKKQETEGSGLKSQEGRCIQELSSLKVPYIKTFPDSYTGGGDFMKRPAMRALLEYIDNNPHKKFVVVFDDLKRFARDIEFHFKLKTAFSYRNVALKCLNYTFDDTPEGRFAEIIMAGQSELERHQNRRQVIQKQKARLELGYWSFGSKKGYLMTKSSEHGTISIQVESEAKILKEALEGFANGTFVRKIDVCKFLVEKGLWKKQSPEKYIDKLENAILRDPFYAGFIEYPMWEVSRRLGKHKPIISLETFELIQKRLDRGDFGKRIRKDTSDDFPLRGLLVCADCESHLTAAWCKGRNRRHPYYYCQKKGCVNKGRIVRKDVIEDEFNNILKSITLKKDVSKLVKVVFDKVWKDEVKNIRIKHNDLSFKKANLEKQVGEFMELLVSAKSENVKKAYESHIERISNEIELIDSTIPAENFDFDIPYQTALDKANGLLKSPYKIWITLDTKEKQNLFYFIFENKLKYSVEEGYRTNKIPSAVRLFEEFSTLETPYVEKTGIEPVCRRFS